MIIAVPLVTRLKCLRSAGRCQGSLPFLPITPLSARATTIVTWGSSRSRRHPSGGAPRKVALCGDPEGWGPDRVSMDASLRWHDGEEHHTATGAGMCGWGSYSVISKSSYSYWSKIGRAHV